MTSPEEVSDVLTAYRDAIQFTHDQTVRFMNQGLRPDEIVQRVHMPAHLAGHPWLGEFYGTLKHCIPAIYVGKVGWFSGDPVDLDPLPPAERARRYVALMGGAEAVRTAGMVVADATHRSRLADPRGGRARRHRRCAATPTPREGSRRGPALVFRTRRSPCATPPPTPSVRCAR